jgi:non-ribosomal peptide synthetase component F
MIPSAFVVLKSLPVTPNGKVDRKALPAPDTGGELARAYVPPRTPTEELLSKLWAEALGLGQVGIRDNFFALGGHSLLATQMISQIRAIFEINLPLQRLWERPTIAALAQSVNSAIARGKVLEFPPLARVPRDPPPPLSIAQEWIWSLSQEECGNRAYNIPAAVRMLGRLDTMALEVSLRGLVQRHEILRTTFPIECGKPVQKIAPQIDLSYSRIDLSGYHAEDREIEMRRILEEEAQRIFDLAHGPLLRVFLLVLGERDHVFALMLHHIVTDGWSTDILIRDFAHLYSAALRKEPSRLPELRVQYADYSCWQQNWMTGLILEDQLAYWRSKLDRAPAVLELATDRPRAPVQTYRGATLDFEVSTAVARCLHALARAADATLFMILLGAFKVMLMRYSGKDDLCVGTWTANRMQANVEDLIGLFADTQALRTDLSGDPTFRTLLERVRKTVLEAQVHHELPFEKLVQELRPEYDPSRHPLFQVMFVLQNSPLRSLELPELHVAPLRVRTRTARFDLTLAMMERETGLVGEWEYNTDLFDEDTAARMLRDYVVLLDRIVANPESSLSELTCFSEAAADSGSSPEQYVSNVSSSVLVDVTASCSKMK